MIRRLSYPFEKPKRLALQFIKYNPKQSAPLIYTVKQARGTAYPAPSFLLQFTVPTLLCPFDRLQGKHDQHQGGRQDPDDVALEKDLRHGTHVHVVDLTYLG